MRPCSPHACTLFVHLLMLLVQVLGDTIALMAGGRLRALGTPLRLKQRWGDGYRLSIALRRPPQEPQEPPQVEHGGDAAAVRPAVPEQDAAAAAGGRAEQRMHALQAEVERLLGGGVQLECGISHLHLQVRADDGCMHCMMPCMSLCLQLQWGEGELPLFMMRPFWGE